MATSFTEKRDTTIPRGEPRVRHLRHQSVEPDAPVAGRSRSNHHLCRHPVYVRPSPDVARKP